MTFGTQICGDCGHNFCEECVVFPFGPKKAPVCISCALELGGISSRATGRPKLSRQSIRERRAAQRKAQKTARKEQAPVGSQSAGAGPEQDEPDAAPTPQHWIDDSENIEAVPGGWSQTYR